DPGRQDRLRARYSTDPSRDRRPGFADLCQRLPAAAPVDGALLRLRVRPWRASSARWERIQWCWRAAACLITPGNAMLLPTLPGTVTRSPGLPPATSNRWSVTARP